MEVTLLGKRFVRDEKANDDAAEPGLVEIDSPLESIGLTRTPFAAWKLYCSYLAISHQYASSQLSKEHDAVIDCWCNIEAA